MMHRQQGFSLLEIVVAFTIIAIVTTLSVNVVAQNASRIHRLDSHARVMNAAENAVALLRMEMMNDREKVKAEYRGSLNSTYSWKAEVQNMHEADQATPKVLNLYKVAMTVFQNDKEQPVYRLVTMLVDK